MTKRTKHALASVLAAALTISSVGISSQETEAAKKISLSPKKVSLTEGKTKKVSVKNAKKGKVTWSIKNKKVASLKKSGKYAVKVKAKKKGTTSLICKVKKKGKVTKKTCKITVKAKAKEQPVSPSPSTEPTATATAAAATQTPVPTNSATPVPSPTPVWTVDPNRTAGPETLLEASKGVFENLGTCLTYNGGNWGVYKPSQLQEAETMEYVRKNYNSFTLENEMKPEALLATTGNGWNPSADTISVEEAKALGYYIPDNYKEATVPRLRFDVVDATLEAAKKYGVRMRGHTLMWHQQTRTWFFCKDYKQGSKVSKEVMDARLEFFVRNVMDHVMDKEKELNGENGAGSIVYAWDVVNEYLHRDNAATSPSWADVYGDMGLTPTYVKDAFTYAYEELEKYGVQDKVVLFNNDYDTYFEVDDMVKLVNYINSDKKVCGGIGMQSHVDVDRPTLAEYAAAVDAFLATGLEVQITELDVTINFDHVEDGQGNDFGHLDAGQTEEDQALFFHDLMTLLVNKQKNRDKTVSPKGITGVTIWGLYDACSWRNGMSPLLADQNMTDFKPSYFAVLDALKAGK